MIYLTLLVLGVAAVLTLLSLTSRVGRKITLYFILILVAVIMAFPFIMMMFMSTHTTRAIYSWPPKFYFGQNLGKNFENMNKMVNFGQAFLNSTIVSVSYTTLCLLFCSMGGYAFAVYAFPGRNVLFRIMILTMMVPWTAGIIPWYMLMSKLGWMNSLYALIIPGCANAFGIFWMRQYCQNNVPVSLIDAAKIDGCSEWTIFFRCISPILLPAYGALGIMQFVNNWNEFVMAAMILRKERFYTLPVMLKAMFTDRGSDYGAIMLTSACVVLPILIVFLCASKMFMAALTAGAVKE